MQHKATEAPQRGDNQTVRLEVETAWSAYVAEIGLREQLRAVLPHAPSSPNACDPTDTALGFIGGILCGADKLARIAHLAHDPALAQVLGIEAVPSQSTFSRFFGACERKACEALAGLHAWSLRDLPERASGYRTKPFRRGRP